MKYILIKSILDRLFALIAIILLSPIFIIVMLLLFFKLGKSIFFIQPRVGADEKVFNIIKFKTMNDDRDENGELLEDDKRLFRLGLFLREYSLDELPQLFNVLKGDMSFIGPRPLLIEYLPLYSSKHKKRHKVHSGITGLAQVSGRNSLSWDKKFDYDIEYVENISFLLDVKIFFMTIVKILTKKDISSSTSKTMEKFNGYK